MVTLQPVAPDGLYFKPKIPVWEVLKLENVDIFYGHLEYFTDIWNIL
jgi:hypothetical protein